MAKQTINLGTGELTGDGESIRSAFSKINDNFDELYTKDSNDVVLSAINGHIIPDTDVTYDLGSASNRFRDLYLSGNTIDLGGTTLSIVGGNLQIGGTNIKDVVTAAGVDYSEIQNTPTIPADIADLTDNTNLLGSGNALGFTYSETGGTSEIGVTADVFDFGDGKTIDMQNSNVLFTGSTVSGLYDQDLNTTDAVEFLGVTASTISADNISINAGGVLNLQGENITGVNTLGAVTVNAVDFNGTLTTNSISSPETGNLELEVGRADGGTFSVTAWADKSDLENGWKQILWGYDTDHYEFFVGGDIYAQGSIGGTLTGNVAKVDEAFAVSVDTTGLDPTPFVWVFVNTYGSGTSLTIPRADAGFVLTEAYGIGQATIEGPGFGDTVSAYPINVDIDSDPNNIILTVNDPETESFTNGESYRLEIAETITTAQSQWTFGTDGTLTVPSSTVGGGLGLIWSPADSSIWLSGTNVDKSTDGNGVVLNGGQNDGTGRGGGISLFGGNSTGGTGGSIFIEAGIGQGGADNGVISIGTAYAKTITIGKASQSDNNRFFGNLIGNVENDDDITITIANNDSTTYAWNFGNTGDLTVPGDLRIPGAIYASTSAAIGVVGSWYQDNGTSDGGGVTLQAGAGQRDGGDINITAGSTVDRDGGSIYIKSGNSTSGTAGPITIEAGNPFNRGTATLRASTFQIDANILTVPANITREGSINITTTLGGLTNTWTFDNNGGLEMPGGWATPELILGVQNDETVLWTPGEERYLSLQTSNGAYSWTFGVDGVLNAPGTITVAGNINLNGSRTISPVSVSSFSGDTLTIQSGDTDNEIGNGGALNINGGLGGASGRDGNILINTTRTGGVLIGKSDGTGYDVQTYSRLQIHRGVVENYEGIQDASGVVEHNCDAGHLFYHTSPDANWTVNLTNLNSYAGMSTNIVIVIEQGGTPYYPSALQIDGAAQTIKWLGNVTPTPQANKTEIATFTIFDSGSSYNVLGSYSTYG